MQKDYLSELKAPPQSEEYSTDQPVALRLTPEMRGLKIVLYWSEQ